MKKVKIMPVDVKSVFDEIQKDVLELHYRWRAFNELYSNSGAIDLMNYAAPNFFSYIYDATLSDLVSAISRLTDKKQVAGRDTLGFQQLIHIVEQHNFKQLKIRLNSRLKKYLARDNKKEEKHPIRKHRNKRVSHSSLDVKTDRKARALPILQKKNFEIALADFRDMLNITEEHFGGIPTAYHLFYRTDSGDNLLYHLRVAKNVLESSDKVEILTKFMTA